MMVAVVINWCTFHIIHHKKRRAFRRAAAVEQLDNIGMVQVREGLPLFAESAEKFTAIEPLMHQLNGHLFLVLIVRACRQKNCSHTALPNTPHHLVSSKATPGHRLFLFCLERGCEKCGGRSRIRGSFGSATFRYEI